MGERVRAETAEERVTRVLATYAESAPRGALSPTMSLRRDLEIESLTLVSALLRIGDELGVDFADAGVSLVGVETVGDVIALARRVTATARGEARST
jgi:acyl carrier protein